jgi:hypothetical protein
VKFFWRVAGVCGLVGCVSCASGPPKFFGQVESKPIWIFVHVSKAAGQTDELGGTAAIVDGLVEGLEARGFKTRLYTRDDDVVPPPRIEVWVEKWGDPGRSTRGAGEALKWINPVAGIAVGLANQGGYSVIFRAYREGDDKPVLLERRSGSIGGTSPEASANAGHAVASGVLKKTFE